MNSGPSVGVQGQCRALKQQHTRQVSSSICGARATVSHRSFARKAHSSRLLGANRRPIVAPAAIPRPLANLKNEHARLICGRRVVDRKKKKVGGGKGKTGSRASRLLSPPCVYRSRSEGHDCTRSIETRATVMRESAITSRMWTAVKVDNFRKVIITLTKVSYF